MDVGRFAKVLMIKLLMYEIRFDHDLIPKCLEASETSETDEIYSGYLRFGNAIDNV